jgi:predicted ester cyclase
MTTEEARNKERLKAYVNEVWVEGNVDAIEEYVDPGYVEHNLSGHNPDIEGIDAHRQNVEQFRTAFPDLELDLERIVASGNKTAQLFTCRGTHEGELMGTPPTGNSVEIPAVGITVWDNGKMVEDWSQVDMLGMMEQLGLGPGSGDEPT